MADGETVEEAIHEAENVLISWLETAREFGGPIPTPSSLGRYSGQWRLRAPKSLHAALAMRVKQEGVCLNMLAATLLSKGLGQSDLHHESK